MPHVTPRVEDALQALDESVVELLHAMARAVLNESDTVEISRWQAARIAVLFRDLNTTLGQRYPDLLATPIVGNGTEPAAVG